VPEFFSSWYYKVAKPQSAARVSDFFGKNTARITNWTYQFLIAPQLDTSSLDAPIDQGSRSQSIKKKTNKKIPYGLLDTSSYNGVNKYNNVIKRNSLRELLR
jgi:hypothetical protein